jgi:hypothetical protein
MTIVAPSPTQGRADQLQLRPQSGLFADFRRGVTTAVSGQAMSVVRATNRPVQAANGVSYDVGVNQPELVYTPAGIGITGFALMTYPINNQIRFAGSPLVAYQIAWHGLLPSASINNAIWHIGTSSANNRLTLLRITGGLQARYVNASGAVSSADITGITPQQEIFAVVQMVPDGPDNVRVRLAVRRRVAFETLAWQISALGTSRECGLTYAAGTLTLHRIAGLTDNATDCVTYRILMQSGSASEADLPWNWEPRPAASFAQYGLVDNGFASLQLGAVSTLFLKDDGSYITVGTSAPAQYLAIEPLAITSTYIYLEQI